MTFLKFLIRTASCVVLAASLLKIAYAQTLLPGWIVPQVFYEGQPLVEVGPQSSAQLKGYAETTVGFILRKDVRWHGTWASLNQVSVYQEYNICPGQSLKNNPSSFFCSGAFIAPNKILTAAHCLEDLKCQDIFFVRNGQLAKVVKGVPRSDVFTCKSAHILSEERDLAVIETNQNFSGPVAPLRSVRSAPQQGFIFMLGHPLGMPLHLARGVVTNSNRSFLMAEISAFEGNSGSPVFSQIDGRLLGVLVEGEEDLENSRNLRCHQIVRCKRGQCEGEKISLIHSEELF